MPAIVAGTMLLGAGLAYRIDSVETDLHRTMSTDHMIVREQVQRLDSSPSEVLLLGDSSCLMGLNAVVLGQTWRSEVSNNCTLAYVGPAGYALMLDQARQSARPPRAVILALHPAQFQRDPSWDTWLPFLESIGKPRPRQLNFLRGALDYVRLELLSPLVYSPLPGAYGRFYGGAAAFESFIREGSGTAVDPNAGLDWRTQDEFLAATRGSGGSSRAALNWDYDYQISSTYRDALGHLATSIRVFGPERVALMIMPVPGSRYSPVKQAARAEVLSELRNILGLPHGLDTPGSMPDVYFSTSTHLNRWGQVAYTRLISETLGNSSVVRSLHLSDDIPSSVASSE